MLWTRYDASSSLAGVAEPGQYLKKRPESYMLSLTGDSLRRVRSPAASRPRPRREDRRRLPTRTNTRRLDALGPSLRHRLFSKLADCGATLVQSSVVGRSDASSERHRRRDLRKNILRGESRQAPLCNRAYKKDMESLRALKRSCEMVLRCLWMLVGRRASMIPVGDVDVTSKFQR
jgi:hypothetical protein